jgi:hypothetical protein
MGESTFYERALKLESENIKKIINDIEYNAHDFGELGKFIRLEYVKNIITKYFGEENERKDKE